jgi:hypothetical protein
VARLFATAVIMVRIRIPPKKYKMDDISKGL